MALNGIIGVARMFRLGGKLFLAKFEVKILLFRRDTSGEGGVTDTNFY